MPDDASTGAATSAGGLLVANRSIFERHHRTGIVNFWLTRLLALIASAATAIFAFAAFGLGRVLLAIASGAISVAFLGLRQMLKYRETQVGDGLKFVASVDALLPAVQITIHTPSKVVEEGGTRRYTAAEDATVIRRMQETNHRALLWKVHEKAIEHGLFRLARIVGLYHAHLHKEGERAWERRWWEGHNVLDRPKLLAYERTIGRVLEDTKAALRGEAAREVYEQHPMDLKARPLFKASLRVFGRSIRTPQKSWGGPAVPLG